MPVHSAYIGGKFYFEDSQTENSPAAFVFKPVSENELEVLLSDDRRRFKVEECLTHDKVAGLRSDVAYRLHHCRMHCAVFRTSKHSVALNASRFFPYCTAGKASHATGKKA